MATIGTEGTNRRRILFVAADGKRKTIRLGKMSLVKAEKIKTKIESLIAGQISGSIDDEDSKWLAKLPDKLHKRIAAAGLVKPRQPGTEAPKFTLGKLHTEYFAALTCKPGTRAAHKQGADSVLNFFGAATPLSEITPLLAMKWQQSLRAEDLADATISKRTLTAKMMFARAVDWDLIEKNPFAKLKAGDQKNDARKYFVPREAVAKILDACPDAEWRLIVALARYGGLRTPSEIYPLKWSDIDFEHGRIHITSPKTAHHKGKGERVCPLFPELEKPLLDVQSQAAEGSEYVITRYRHMNTNLRTHFRRIIKNAGLVPWERLFQNLRASRASELADQYPGFVAAAWLGHSEEVAKGHYWMTLESHFAKALGKPTEKAAQNQAQQPPEIIGSVRKEQTADAQETAEIPAVADDCRELQEAGMGALGFEPRTKGL